MTTITSLFPALTSFDASSNAYNNLTDHFLTSTITDLTFEENAFSALSNLNPIARLPNLQRLVLKSNKISDIATGSRPAPVFSPTVKEVDLSFNEISTWSFIDRLIQVFPGLTSLRVSQNPLYRSLQAADGRALSAEDGYMLTIARIGSLKMLNYSPITDKERLNAESYYLSLIARELSFAPKKLEDQIIANHPRYKELCEEYGDPVVKRESNAINPNSLAARLMRLTFYLAEDVKVSAKRNESKLEIPISYTAYALLGIIGRHFEIAPAKCRMIWETGDWLPGQRADGGIQDSSDSENSLDSDDDDKAVTNLDRVMREVEIIPGTRGIGTWIDGMDAVIRVEIK